MGIDKGYVSPSRWAAEVLQNIIPEAITEYRNRKKEAKDTPKLREGLSKTISDAIDKYYRQDSDE